MVSNLNEELTDETEVIQKENGRITLRVNRRDTPSLTAMLLNTYSIADLSIENPPIEAVIDQIYQEGDV
jgi:ABC-2 type transport system ATP-binding protein